LRNPSASRTAIDGYRFALPILRAGCARGRARGEGATLSLEDADHATLVSAVNAMQFAVANKHLLGLIDDILNAKPPQRPAQDRQLSSEAA
jgi:hypothetical protein